MHFFCACFFSGAKKGAFHVFGVCDFTWFVQTVEEAMSAAKSPGNSEVAEVFAVFVLFFQRWNQ